MFCKILWNKASMLSPMLSKNNHHQSPLMCYMVIRLGIIATISQFNPIKAVLLFINTVSPKFQVKKKGNVNGNRSKKLFSPIAISNTTFLKLSC